MLSTAKIRGSSWRYYQNTVAAGACEYFLGHNDTPGRWDGTGLSALGLVAGSEVTERELEALFGRALSPSTGARLGRGWRADAVTGYDLTFSAPKSVSALWALSDATTVAAIDAAHAAAVHAALGYLQTHASNSRRGRDGVDQINTAGYAAALFDHRTSRTGDPQLHTHCLVVNKVHCQDGVWRTLDGYDLFHHKKSAGVLYQTALRTELEARLPLVFGDVNEHGQADILGVPDALLGVWSTRTSAVMADAVPTIAAAEEHLGRPVTAAERARIIKTAVTSTRPAKEHDVTEADLRARWRTQADTAGYPNNAVTTAVRDACAGVRGDDAGASGRTHASGHASARTHDASGYASARASGPADAPEPGDSTLDASHPPVVTDGDWRDRVVADAVTAVGRTTAVWSRANLTAQIAARVPRTQHASGAPRTATDIVDLVEDLTDRALTGGSSGAVGLGEVSQGGTARASDARYASRELIETEARIVERVITGGFRDPVSLPAALVEVAAAVGRVPLSWEQQRVAVRLVASRDLVTVLTAPAGAGKTTTLAAAVRMWEHRHVPVTALAPSARAAGELAAATGVPGRTVASFLLQHQHDEVVARGRFQREPVLLVDEASMLSTADLDALTGYAERHQARLALVGDPGQIGAVNASGGMFEHLTDRLGPWAAELTELHRFHTHGEGPASLAIRAGDPGGLGWYAREGRIHPHSDALDAADGVFTHWHTAVQDGKDALMVARAWSDVTALNARARAAAIATGVVTGPDLLTVTSRTPSTGNRPEPRSWRAGDLLTTKKNTPHLRIGDATIRNGDRFRVLNAVIATDGRVTGLVVADLAGRGTTPLPVAYLARHAEYGWASTIDGAQGATADVGILLARTGLDREHFYVAMTRGRDTNHVHTAPDKPLGDAGPHHHALATAATLPENGHGTHDDERTGQLRFPDLEPDVDTEPTPMPRTVDISTAITQLSAAVRSSGREHAAHTLLDQPVTRAADRVWRTRDDQTPARPLPLPQDHTLRQRDLATAITRRDDAYQHAHHISTTVRHTETTLGALPFWSRRTRRDLERSLLTQQQDLTVAVTAAERADTTVTTLQGPVDLDTAQRLAQATDDRDRRHDDWAALPHRPYTHPTVTPNPRPPGSTGSGRPGALPAPSIRRPPPSYQPPAPLPPIHELYR